MAAKKRTTTSLRRARAGVTSLALTCLLATLGLLSLASTALAANPFQIVGFDGGAFTETGDTETQAGAHPYLASTTFHIATTTVADGTTDEPNSPVKDVDVALPPGLVGNPQAAPTCTQAQLKIGGEKTTCPIASQVGYAILWRVGNFSTAGTTNNVYLPIFNLQAPRGTPALFGFNVAGAIIYIGAHVRTGDDYGVTLSGHEAPTATPFSGFTATLWGVPASPIHDGERGSGGFAAHGSSCANPEQPASCSNSSTGPLKPLITLPTSCTGPVRTSISMTSWGGGRDSSFFISHDTAIPPNLVGNDGCEAVNFAPTVQARPTTNAADSPTGLDVRLHIPQNEAPTGIAEANLRDTTVVLPPGLTVNPSSANGLGACTEDQFGFTGKEGDIVHTTSTAATCPASARLANVSIDTPLLDHSLHGGVYLATPYENPFDSLLALYITVSDPESGVVVKLAGRVEANPGTGQLTAVFTRNPQLPFEDLELQFAGGAGAPLISPQTCGTKTTTAELTPWTAPYSPSVATSDAFAVTSGANGGACPPSQAAAPNAPSFEAGTTFTNAGLYSPFVLKLNRDDGSQRLRALNVSLPPGLTGRLAGIPYCTEAQIAQAQGRSHPGEGTIEQAAPSCPAASQIGRVTVGAGAGTHPYYAQGRAYLAGPYRGAPLSMVIVTPAVAGPFDLGTVVVRTGLYVDPETAEITARSDSLPTILEGIPLDIRSIVVQLDRPGGFTLNPTSCEAMSITGEAISTTGNTVPLNNRFQVGGCRDLPFHPKLALRVFGKMNRNAKPRFRAVLTAKPGEANIARAQVNLPHSEFLEQNHIKTICTRVQWAAGDGHGSACPKGSIYGRAKAWTPLLAEPLQGPVYLRSSSHKLPDLVAALNGQVDVELSGKVDSGPNEGIRNTFEVVPDAPVSRFILEMKGGKKGLLVNSENLCSKHAKTRAIVRFTGQNGKVHAFKPKVNNRCRKHRKHAKHKRVKHIMVQAIAGRMSAWRSW